MKYYYIEIKGQQQGPWTIEELKNMRLTKGSLAWTDGMTDWDKVENIDELKDFAIPTPPPLKVSEAQNNSNISQKKDSKYDNNYEKASEAVIVGFVFIIINCVIIFGGLNKFKTKEEVANYNFIVGFISFIFRIIITVWVSNIAKGQNRDTFGWGIFAFFFPTLALIIIGFHRKLKGDDQPITSKIETPNKEEAKSITVRFKSNKRLETFDLKYWETVKDYYGEENFDIIKYYK
ncbi:MAG TPA: DUF4339 domain-containing protein [Bacteroidales bacterium]|nr:DUF4339 domain-containing protein [Bacteroidales bacterium]HPS16921.1 DUF4339 domain-containing protein [Bacteroidales bacterium]